MRNLIIKYFALSYNVKLFGTNFRYLRAVLPTIFFFCLAGLYTTAQEYQSVWDFQTLDFLLWTPVLICFWFGFNWFGLGYFRQFPIGYNDLQDWEQEHQFINAPDLVKKGQFPVTREQLNDMYDSKYKTDESWVNVFLGVFPFAVLIVTGIVAYILLG